jgi:hypothetical protein
MSTQVPISLVVGMAAYLRQLELSIHRAGSLKQFADFLSKRSIQPSIAINALRQCHPQAISPLTDNEWATLAQRTESTANLMKLALKKCFWKTASASIANEVISASIQAIQSVERLLGADETDVTAINRLRQMLHTCAELLLMHVTPSSVRDQIRRVEHPNSAQHLETIPISMITGWPFHAS